MKYVRKIAVYLISVIILASLVIGCGMIFSVRNVNVTVLGYSDSAKDGVSDVKIKLLALYRGTVMAFVDEDDVVNSIDGGKYVVESCEKIMPCTLNVTIKERMECYYVANGDGFSVYDDGGAYIRRAQDEAGARNEFDGAANVKIYGAENDDDFKSVAKAGEAFKEKFSSLRAVTSSVTLQKSKSEIVPSRIIFTLKSGLEIEIQNFETALAEKTAAVYARFERLSAEQKLKGRVFGYSLPDGTVGATYTAA